MTIREWLSSCRQYFDDISKARRGLIESNVLDTAPIWTRLWHAHLLWAIRGCSFQFRHTASFVWHWFLRRYCRAVDRLFGGTRYAQYQEGQRQEAKRHQRTVAELKKQQQERKQRNFERELLIEALTNPNFVVNSRMNQDDIS